MTRPTLPRGLTRTPKGWRLYVSRGPGLPAYRKRFPPSTSEQDVLAELAKARETERAGRREAPSGTLAGDVQRYLTAYFHSHPGRAERQRHLNLWIDALTGSTPRRQITREDISRVLQAWKASGLSADTCNKRRTALMALYNALDGRSGSNPVRDVQKFRSAPPLPRAIDYKAIEKALRQLPKCKTRARLKVMAYTGARPVQIRRLQPENWDEKRGTLLLHATEKGRGTKPHLIPLAPKAQSAMREFEDTDAWGPFASAPMARMWKAAAVKAGLPASAVPYDLRHSFGTAVYQSTGDLRITKELMGHASLTMTERYTLAAVKPGQVAAIAAAFPKRRKS